MPYTSFKEHYELQTEIRDLIAVNSCKIGPIYLQEKT